MPESIENTIIRLKKRTERMKPEERAAAQMKIDEVKSELSHAIYVAKHSDEIINTADEEFDKYTAFTKVDWIFLGLATTLQIVRQYVLTPFAERLDDQTAAKQTSGHIKEHSNRSHRWYHPSIDEIISNPVPFDAMQGSKKFGAGLSGTTHRTRALGHDPILGYVFGTMNILTSTLTTSNFLSYHIKTAENKRDYLSNPAKTSLVVKYSAQRVIDEGWEGKEAFASAFLKEFIHLKSDVKTKDGLPFPGISVYDADLARKLANYGLDVQNIATIGKQASLSIIINYLISMLHRLCMPDDIDEKMYAAKTRKVLMFSNLAATSSNLVYTAVSQNYKKLDIGGSVVAIYRLLSDSKFITDLRMEFRNKYLENKLITVK